MLLMKNSGTIDNIVSPLLNECKDEETANSALTTFRAMEEEIERRKIEVRGKVLAQLGRMEEETKRLAEIRGEIEGLSDPMRKEVAVIRKRIDLINRDLKPLGQSCRKKEKEYKEAIEAFNEKNKEKGQLIGKLLEVYRGLDVLTNKVPVHEQKGVPHHLLGTVSPNVEFTAKDFRDSAIPLIDEIWSRNCLPVIVGGTNYYIQIASVILQKYQFSGTFSWALVSQFLLDDHAEDPETNCLLDIPDQAISEFICAFWNTSKQTFPGERHAGQNWGRADNLRYDCCFICLDASLPALDQYVNQRVDLMVSAGLLEEVRDIYELNADYTRGLRQAIGVREFEDFLKYWNSECLQSSACPEFNENICQIMDSTGYDQTKLMLKEAIEKVKLNTRRLVRRQKRRFSRLQMLFGWSIHFIDVTSCLLCDSDNIWAVEVVEPSVNLIKSFLNETASPEATKRGCEDTKLAQRDLWTQYVCQACGNKELRGAHEWEQHQRGRSHRKRVSHLRKSGASCQI
ncbi:UNVERIFIED_CONTAM: tRNA dimethylallyltransferase 2 [Sesamum radiatum]|uniref:tRNA dimethylallyltransferase 2 n=1 Tax=Sesamum radiatum TaxID=300843 RepID=A0AAW2W509_SESRA